MKSFHSDTQTHQKRVLEFLKFKRQKYFSIVETCNTQNNQVLNLDNIHLSVPENLPSVAFTPAAGAATRYNQVYEGLLSQIDAKNIDGSEAELAKLQKTLEDCPIPRLLKSLFNKKISPANLDQMSAELNQPKALYPGVTDGHNFLEIKNKEHNEIFKLAGQVFVVTSENLNHFKSLGKKLESMIPVAFLDQNQSLCTYRFKENGEVAKSANGEPAWVAGGHGMLVKLFPEVKKLFPKARSVFIRNIDNIQGSNTVSKAATDKFFEFYSFMLEKMEQIRHQLNDNELKQADETASQILKTLSLTGSNLKDLQNKVFHTPQTKVDLKELFQRPLNILGMVPNTGNDIGGTACVVDLEGQKIKICLEVPHASEEDKKKHLSLPESFFNPVFILAELSKNIDSAYQTHPFWAVAQKSYKNETVYYHEELLSEVLGNSLNANCLFVALPRSIFNPHKTVFDSKGKSLAHWF